MAKRKTDNRKAQWTLRLGLAKEIGDCFRSTAALHKTLDTNANTWFKLETGDPVKKRTARDAAEEFLEFLRDYDSGKTDKDSSKYYDQKIRECIDKYSRTDTEYEALIERVGDD